MKLIIQRDQERATSFLGGDKGIRFLLSCEVQLTAEEEELVARYRAEKFVLTQIDAELPSQGVTIADLMDGAVYECEGVTGLLEVEEKIKEACKQLKVLLDVMQSFGGKEEIEF